ncbi:hypothetical protein NDU88_005917, partial [Pleurodeles waltl]
GTPLPDGARVVLLEPAVFGLSRRALAFLAFFSGGGLAVSLLLAEVAGLKGGGLQNPWTIVFV